MQLTNLKQAPFNTTLMGVLKGVLEYYKYDYSDAFIYGASGHAFLINIHKDLCPSSPYCWNGEFMVETVKQMGLQMTDMGFFSLKSSRESKQLLLEKIIECLDKGLPCSLLNMENQLIYGYEDAKLLTTQPWECNPNFPPSTLTFNDWEELNGEIHINFFSYRKVKATSKKQLFKDSIELAIDLYENPQNYSIDSYGIGPDAYKNFIQAIKEHGSTHGNWWNATVWGECRIMAGKYLLECSEFYGEDVKVKLISISELYTRIGIILQNASSKEMPHHEKISILTTASELENQAIQGLKEIVSLI